MLIDNEEEVESTETEETEEVEETEETETEKEEEKPEEKPKETLEQKEARLERQLKSTRKKLGKDEEKVEKKSGGFDYGQKAYLKSSGIESTKEMDFVQKELKESGLELDALLENGYFKDKLEKFRAIGKTTDAIPKGKRGGGVATDSVEYWAGKPIEEVPQDMRIQVVNYRLKKEAGSGVFYNS